MSDMKLGMLQINMNLDTGEGNIGFNNHEIPKLFKPEELREIMHPIYYQMLITEIKVRMGEHNKLVKPANVIINLKDELKR